MKSRSLTLKITLLVVAALAAACTPKSGAPLTVSDVRLFAPLTSNHSAVGYLTLHNQSKTALTIDSISSSSFASIQMHETIISDGVARMQALQAVIIEPGSSLAFAAGGKHLMLMQPTADSAAGANITLEIHYDSGGLLIISATMQTRMSTE